MVNLIRIALSFFALIFLASVSNAFTQDEVNVLSSNLRQIKNHDWSRSLTLKNSPSLRQLSKQDIIDDYTDTETGFLNDFGKKVDQLSKATVSRKGSDIDTTFMAYQLKPEYGGDHFYRLNYTHMEDVQIMVKEQTCLPIIDKLSRVFGQPNQLVDRSEPKPQGDTFMHSESIEAEWDIANTRASYSCFSISFAGEVENFRKRISYFSSLELGSKDSIQSLIPIIYLRCSQEMTITFADGDKREVIQDPIIIGFDEDKSKIIYGLSKNTLADNIFVGENSINAEYIKKNKEYGEIEANLSISRLDGSLRETYKVYDETLGEIEIEISGMCVKTDMQKKLF